MEDSAKVSAAAATAPSFLISFSISCALFALLSGSFSFWELREIAQVPAAHKVLPLPAAGLIVSLLWFVLIKQLPRFSLEGFAWGLVTIFVADWFSRRYSFYPGSAIRGELLAGALFSWYLLRRRRSHLLSLLAIATPVLLVSLFLQTAGDRLLFSDDHATFLYRLMLLKDNFPFVPFYYSLWNGGVDERAFFATGAIGFFLAAAPLVYLFDLPQSYNAVIIYILFILTPLCAYAAAKIEGIRTPGPAFAAVLSLTANLLWYHWALLFGTMGFITSTALLPLNLALLRKLLDPHEALTGIQAALLTITFTLMVLWSPSGLVIIPLIAWGTLKIKTVARKPYAVVVIAALLLINIPWMTLFWSVSNVSKFVKAEKPTQITSAHQHSAAPVSSTRPTLKKRAEKPTPRKSLSVVRENTIPINPLLIFIGIPGIFMLRRTSRTLYLITFTWLAFLGSVISLLKPQLELERMFVMLSLAAVLPAANGLQRLFENAERRPNSWLKVIPAALAGGMLIIAPLSGGAAVLNRRTMHYHFTNPLLENIVAAINEFAGEGRVLFAGFTLHEICNGHAAPLAPLTGIPLIASSYMHNLWRYEQVFPKEFISRKNEGIDDYLDLYNVTAVIAHEPEWRSYFEKRKRHFELKWSSPPFSLYTRRRTPDDGYFLEGSGKIISQTPRGIKLELSTTDAVLKFNYFDFLESSACSISEEMVSKNVRFIRLSDCPTGQVVTIDSAPPLRRTFKR